MTAHSEGRCEPPAAAWHTGRRKNGNDGAQRKKRGRGKGDSTCQENYIYVPLPSEIWKI